MTEPNENPEFNYEEFEKEAIQGLCLAAGFRFSA